MGAILIMGAGIIVLKKFKEEYKVLCLYEEKGKSAIRKYDLTKGALDKGETFLEAAVRETYEESGIKNLKFTWGKKSIERGKLRMFIAETKDNPKILKNPKTGKFEHDGFEWNTLEVAHILMPDYLKPFILWVSKTIKGASNV